MPDWLQSPFHADAELSLDFLVVRLLVAFALGCVVAGICRFTQAKGPARSNGLIATLVLLTILIAMMTLVIGNNVARAFGIVGALAIVRFRTIVEDTRDTAFVIFAVAVGTAIGAGFLKVTLVCIPIAAIAAWLFRPRGAAGPFGAIGYTLNVRMGSGIGGERALHSSMAGLVTDARLQSVVTARQGAAVELGYSVSIKTDSDAGALVARLNSVEGVQSVELTRD